MTKKEQSGDYDNLNTIKKNVCPILLIAILLLLAGCTINSETSNRQLPPKTTGAAPTNVYEATLAIEGMTCASCALGVEYQLKQVEGVLDAKISYEEAEGRVKYDADKTNANTIAQASDVYPAKVMITKKVA